MSDFVSEDDLRRCVLRITGLGQAVHLLADIYSTEPSKSAALSAIGEIIDEEAGRISEALDWKTVRFVPKDSDLSAGPVEPIVRQPRRVQQ